MTAVSSVRACRLALTSLRFLHDEHCSSTTPRQALFRYSRPRTPYAPLLASGAFSKPYLVIQRQRRSVLKEFIEVEGFRIRSDVFVKSGDTVELEDGSFLRVKRVLYDMLHKEKYVEGWKFVRNADTLDLSRHNPYEVYWSVQLAAMDSKSIADQALVEVGCSQVRCRRIMKMVKMTSLSDCERYGDLRNDVFLCGWKHVFKTKTGKHDRPPDAFSLPAREIEEASFERLTEEECDNIFNSHIAPKSLRRSWPGIRKRRDAGIKRRKDDSLLSAIGNLSINDEPQSINVLVSYTYVDICCGAGGASWGARMAGLELRGALDHDAAACITYSLNFPQTVLCHEAIAEIGSDERPDLRSDIMHCSFPCQALSQANTTPNREKDDLNIATNMELGRLLDVAKPRVVTLEQTAGLMRLGCRGGRHSNSFDRFISQFTSRGYNIALEILDMAEFGLPQRRERLIMIASR